MDHWDKIEAQKLREQGLTQEQIGFVIGLIAEHRMCSDQVGYNRGYNNGHLNGYEKGFKEGFDYAE